MKRRHFIELAAASWLSFLHPLKVQAGNPGHIIKPPKLNPGDTIGLITPASPLFEANETLISVKEKIGQLGFLPKPGRHIFKKNGFSAGTVAERVDDLQAMFTDPQVKAIMAIRGGYSSLQLLPHLDYDLIAANPKILIGYSDITSLLLGISTRTGLVTFHGPVGVSSFTAYTRELFTRTLMNAEPAGLIDDAPFEGSLQVTNQVWTVRPGQAEGRLTGGNLTLIQATLGTAFEINTDDAILFIEEVGEEPYDLDRMLNHLKQAGKFNKCRGVVFDRMPSVQPAEYKPAFNNTQSKEEIISEIFKDSNFPVCLGLSFGHVADKPVLPLGIHAALDAGSGRLSLLESAVL